MSKKLTSIRFDEATAAQVKALAGIYGTQSTAIAVAIDRLYRSHFGDKPPARGGKDGE